MGASGRSFFLGYFWMFKIVIFVVHLPFGWLMESLSGSFFDVRVLSGVVFASRGRL